MYTNTTFNYFDRILRNVLTSTLISGFVVYSVTMFINTQYLNVYINRIFIATCAILLLIERYAYIIIAKQLFGRHAINVIIVGIPKIVEKFEYYLEKTNININILGYVRIDPVEPQDAALSTSGKPILGNIENLNEIMKSNVVDEVIFALKKENIDSMEKYILMCEEMGITARMVIELYDLRIARTYLSSMGTLPMITFHTVSLNRFQLLMKRLIDIIGSIFGLVITALVSIAVIPAIKLDSPGPILFKQSRVGLNGRVFNLYKFRSMYKNADVEKLTLVNQGKESTGYMFKLKDDPRITRIGYILRKLSIDELPQFFNVLKGEMSLVGTRPPTIDEIALYNNRFRRRISIKPGMTGLWQVSGRSNITDFNEVVNLDTMYIDKWSVWLDMKILFRTLFVVLKTTGAY